MDLEDVVVAMVFVTVLHTAGLCPLEVPATSSGTDSFEP